MAVALADDDHSQLFHRLFDLRLAYDGKAQRIRKVMGRLATQTMFHSAGRMYECVMMGVNSVAGYSVGISLFGMGRRELLCSCSVIDAVGND